MKTKMHITSEYLMNPTHPVTVNLIGCGGTGSQVLSCLGRMDHALKALNHPGLHVTVYDPDIVSNANVGRQLFCYSDVGLNKAVLLTTRMNAFFGLSWDAIPDKLNKTNARKCNITISCVDNVQSRLEIDQILLSQTRTLRHVDPYKIPFYWLDFGNSTNTGQVILGTISNIKQPLSKQFKTVEKIPTVTKRFDLSTINEEESGPSCSLAEALQKQDLFINSSLAQLGIDLIWKLLREGMIDKAGLYLNLQSVNLNAINL